MRRASLPTRKSLISSTAAATAAALPSTTGSPQPTTPDAVVIFKKHQRGGTMKVSSERISIGVSRRRCRPRRTPAKTAFRAVPAKLLPHVFHVPRDAETGRAAKIRESFVVMDAAAAAADDLERGGNHR